MCAKSRAVTFEQHYGSEQRARFVACHLPCAACRQAYFRNHNHHVRTRSAGGTHLDIVPLCPQCHREIHQDGRETFERRYKVDLAQKARDTEDAWQQWGHEEGLDF